MSNAKKISLFHSSTGKTVYSIIRRADGYLLNDVDGTFASAPADPYLALTEDAVIKGLYEISESRATWIDGKYEIFIYEQVGGSPVPVSDKQIGSGEMYIRNDQEATMLSPVTVSLAQLYSGVLDDTITITDEPVEVRRGDAKRLNFTFGSAYAKSGAKFYFCAKKNQMDDNGTAIVNREITLTDPGTITGYIDLTAVETAATGMYYAEVERRDSDGTSNPLTVWEAEFRIKQDTRQ